MTQRLVYYDDATGQIYAAPTVVGLPTPTLIAGDSTYTVAEDTQMLVGLPIRVDGTLTIKGAVLVL